MIYQVRDYPGLWKTIIFALQQLLAILAATIAVPAIIGNGMSQAAALFGAGMGTIVYLLFTKFKSPVFLGSSFAFLGSMAAAFAGGVSMSAGYLGLIIGAAMAGLVYVIFALIIKFAGTGWIDKLMPAVVIGPTVAIIGLSLAGNAVGDLVTGSYIENADSWSTYIGLVCGLTAMIVTIVCSVYGKKMMKMIPFIIGIAAGYILALLFTGIGYWVGLEGFKLINFEKFNSMKWYPEFTFITAFSGNYGWGELGSFWAYLGKIAVAYIPVSCVVLAEHISDHKNLGTVIGVDLLRDPGLDRTLLGDGVGSIAGAFFGGCPNTTYGESVGCVAISKNASIWTTLATAILAIVVSFIAPFTTLLATIPSCVMGGICITLYGFIACSGLKMLKEVDLNDNSNIFVVSAILITGIGGLVLKFAGIEITEVACALIIGIIVNLIANRGTHSKNNQETE